VSTNASGCHQWTNKRGVNGSGERDIPGHTDGIQLSIISLGSHQLLPVADNLYGIVLTGNVRYTYDLNSDDSPCSRSIEWSENLRFERNFTYENSPSIEHEDYCWRKVEEFLECNGGLGTYSVE